MLTFDLVSQKQPECFLSADFSKARHSQIAFFSVHFPWFFIAVACLTRLLT